METNTKLLSYLKAILRAEDIETAHSEARLAIQLIEKSQPKKGK